MKKKKTSYRCNTCCDTKQVWNVTDRHTGSIPEICPDCKCVVCDKGIEFAFRQALNISHLNLCQPHKRQMIKILKS